MAPQHANGVRRTGVDQFSQLSPALDETALEHPDVLTWFAEAKRLFAEAEERFEAGQVLPTLSSLAALPPLHRMLVERCSELLVDREPVDAVEPDARPGMYL